MDEPVWQPNYLDLSDDQNVRFAGDCMVCQARYATIAQPLAAALPPESEPDAATRKANDDQKYDLFRAFDAAFRAIVIYCYRCGRPACPDCWDDDKQMCGACVAERGLIRSPHRGEPVAGPLADGFLRRMEPGRYAEAGRPAWLKELLRAQADPAAGGPSASGAALAATPPDTSYPRIPVLPANPQLFEAPTHKMPAPGGAPLPPPSFTDVLNGNEGQATSSLIECPRCGAPNYDFVTQCSECGLQMIQVCPACDRLNPGHIDRCQFCDAPLEQPGGWTAVSGAIKPLDLKEGRKRMASRPIAPPAVTPLPAMPRPANAAARAPVASIPVAPAQRAAASRAVLELQSVPPPAPDPPSDAHPYALVGSDLRPVPMTMPAAYKVPFGTRLGVAFERLLTITVIVALLALVGIVTAAEVSPQADHWLLLTLHIDVKRHIDGFLSWLQVAFHQH
ncbi:MAG TPA: zinc ribbon domain-containing protein [Ktedonobacterales bacterium]